MFLYENLEGHHAEFNQGGYILSISLDVIQTEFDIDQYDGEYDECDTKDVECGEVLAEHQ